MKKIMSEIYIMALKVGPKPQKCNVSNHGIAHINLIPKHILVKRKLNVCKISRHFEYNVEKMLNHTVIVLIPSDKSISHY